MPPKIKEWLPESVLLKGIIYTELWCYGGTGFTL